MKKIIVILFFAFIANNVYCQEIYEINWIGSNSEHYQGALVMFKDNTGKLRVRYHKESGIAMVEQTIRIEATQVGNRLSGYNPVYPNTSTTFPYYNADNFYLIVDAVGNLTITNIDDAGSTSKASIRYIEGTEKNEFLLLFNWKL
jgi:hypothetical protein